MRERRRTLLLVVVPLIAVVGGIAFYLSGGRYATTDDAYVGAQKVLITPDISGKIDKVVVKEGQHVNVNDVLFEIDPIPFRFALQQAKATLDQAKTNYDNLKSNYKSYAQLLELAQQGVEVKQRDVDRKATLVKSSAGSQLDLDTSTTNLVLARAQFELLQQQLANSTNQLLGNPDLPLEQFPPYTQAKAALDQAQRNLDHTVLRAPMSGTATQVDQIQLGRFVAAGTPMFSVIDDTAPWVDANLKGPISLTWPMASLLRCRWMHFLIIPSKEPLVRSAQEPARNSQSCRRKTRPGTSSRSCSVFRSEFISTLMMPP